MEPITLAVGQTIEIVVDGRSLTIHAERHDDGTPIAVLGSNDSDLEGIAPGEYCLNPSAD